jgi:hypothetical protein
MERSNGEHPVDDFEGQDFRWLLDELPEDEREALEARALEDPDEFERLLAAEDDLLDARARGELSPEEEQRFDEGLGQIPRIQQRLEIARLLAEEGSKSGTEEEPLARIPPAHRPRFSAPFLALAAVVFLAISLPVLWRLTISDTHLDTPPQEPLLLRSSVNRSTETESETLPVAPGVESLPLYLELPAGVTAGRYRVEIIEPIRGTVWTGEGLVADSFSWGQAVPLNPPVASLLLPGSPSAELRFVLFAEGEESFLAEYVLRLEQAP